MDLARFGRRLKRWIVVSGFSYKCPMCTYPMGKFLPFGIDAPVLNEKKVVGGGYREQAKCYICGCLDRERLIYMYLTHHTKSFQKESKILHFAPEPVLSQKICKAVDTKGYITADIIPGRADEVVDMTDIPYGDDTFDLIIANHVLEHIPDDKKAMSELRRVLKKVTGKAILQVPISLNSKQTLEDLTIDTNDGRLQAYGQDDHVRIYGQDYPDKLRQAGFEVDIFDWANSKFLNPNKHNKYGFVENELIFIVSDK